MKVSTCIAVKIIPMTRAVKSSFSASGRYFTIVPRKNAEVGLGLGVEFIG